MIGKFGKVGKILQEQRMSASNLFEITAATTLKTYAGAFGLIGEITKLIEKGKSDSLKEKRK